MRYLNKNAVKFLLVWIIILSLFYSLLNKLAKSDYWKSESWMTDNQNLFKLIPKSASLATQQNLAPHLSHRQEIHLLWPREHDFENNFCGQKTCWWLDFGGKPQYLVVDLHPNQWLTQILESNENFQSAVSNMEKAGEITLEKEINFAKLYRINY